VSHPAPGLRTAAPSAAAVDVPPAVARPEELSGFGVRVRVLSTTGNHTVLEYHAPPGFPGPRPHRHDRTTEWFRVVAGRLAVATPAGDTVAEAGDFVEIPPGRAHAWRNADPDRPLVFLFGFDRPGMAGYFRDLMWLARTAPAWPPVDPEPVLRLGLAYDTLPA
jgi:quercetin dioxygenase-like cupin family protein